MASKVVIIGGHGKIALRLARLLSQKSFAVTSVIRDASQSSDITALSATPHVLSLEDAPVSAFSALFKGSKVVYFAAGAGGRGGPEKTKAVDYEGAVKVFDAVENVEGEKPRVILVSALDTRNPDKPDQYPAHYNDADIGYSKKSHTGGMVDYYKWKYEADKNLVSRTAFKWTILRPGTLKDNAGTGKVEAGKTHLGSPIPRDDVAAALAFLADRPDAHGLAIDLIGGEKPISEALDAAVKKGETSFES